MPGIIFLGIDSAPVANRIMMTSEEKMMEDKTRADTPDSSGGGYFTLSESDTGSTPGTQSPHPYIERCNDIYKISKTYTGDTNNRRSRRKRSTSSNFAAAAEYFRTISNQDLFPSKPPPRPPRPTSLPPPIPNRCTDKMNNRTTRSVMIPEQKPLEKKCPLQIQSPSMMKAFQQATSSEEIYDHQYEANQHKNKKSNKAKHGLPEQKNTKNYMYENPSQVHEKTVNEKITYKISSVKSSTWEPKYLGSFADRDSHQQKTDINSVEHKYVNYDHQTTKNACDKNRKFSSEIASSSKDITVLDENKEKKPKISIKSLIHMYDPKQTSSKKLGIDMFETENKTSDILQNMRKISKKIPEINFKETKADDYPSTVGYIDINEQGRKYNNPPTNKTELQNKHTPVKTNSIDEFLRSVKKTKMKYQEMLQKDDNDLEEKILMTDSHEKYENNPNLSFETKIFESEPKKDASKENEKFKPLIQNSSKNMQNKKLFDSNITPTPSPRMKKRTRREQFLQEHKEMGKMVLKMAKSTIDSNERKSWTEEKSDLPDISTTTAGDMNIQTNGQVNLILAAVL